MGHVSVEHVQAGQATCSQGSDSRNMLQKQSRVAVDSIRVSAKGCMLQ